MMASTLADNSSTMPPASGREREQEIAPMASRRRYVCEQLQLEPLLFALFQSADGIVHVVRVGFDRASLNSQFGVIAGIGRCLINVGNPHRTVGRKPA